MIVAKKKMTKIKAHIGETSEELKPHNVILSLISILDIKIYETKYATHLTVSSDLLRLCWRCPN
jgi:hypothetical protein